MSISSDKSNGSTFSLNSHVEPMPVVSCKEETTLVHRTFTYKWHLVGYPFATTTLRSEDFSPPDCPGDAWYLQLEPPKLRVEKGSNVDLTTTGSVSYSTVYSTSAADMHSISPPPPVRFAASGFEYFTDCRLSVLMRKRGDRSHNPVTASFEVGLASDCNPNEPLQTWVAFAETFMPFSEFPSKVISLRGKISDLVHTHKLTRLTITCQLFYNNQKEGNSNNSNHISNIKLNSGSEFLFNGRNSERGNYLEDLQDSLSSASSPAATFEEKNSLINDLRKLFSDPKGRKLAADVAVVGVDGAIEAHRVILIARSPVFREAIETEISRSGESGPQIKVYGVPLKVLRPFVNFLYTDHVSSEELAGISVELLLLADKYKIPKLRLLCEHAVARGLNEDNCADVMALSRTIKSNVIQRRLHEFFN